MSLGKDPSADLRILIVIMREELAALRAIIEGRRRG